jgi:hypothetical protein
MRPAAARATLLPHGPGHGSAAGGIQGAFSASGRQSLPMRYPLALAAICLTAAALAAGGLGISAEETREAAPAVAAPGPPQLRVEECLSPADMREEVSERRVIAPVTAIKAARTVIPRAEIQRASLCRHADGLVYMLTALRRDGHFVHVMVDAKTGQVAGQY